MLRKGASPASARFGKKSLTHYLTYPDWRRLPLLIPLVKPGGRWKRHDPRELAGAIADARSSGHASWLPPHDPAPWQTVYAYFARCQRDVKGAPPLVPALPPNLT